MGKNMVIQVRHRSTAKGEEGTLYEDIGNTLLIRSNEGKKLKIV